MIFEDLDGTERGAAGSPDPRFDGVLRVGADTGLTEALLPVLHRSDSHAATLTRAADGHLLCAWFNGPGEGDRETNIVLSRLAADSDRWTTPELIAADPDHSEQNPVLFTAPDDRIWLLHTSNTPHDRRDARVLARTSDDHGRNWSAARDLLPDRAESEPGLFLRNQPLFLADGDWLLPAYLVGDAGEYSVVLRSSDAGQTWESHRIPGSVGRVQISIAPTADGLLLGLLRSRDADRIYATTSADDGRSWSEPVRTELPNNNSAIQLLRLADDRLVVIFNDATLERDQFRWVDGPDGARTRRKALRTPLTVAVSNDNGRSWPVHRNLQNADLEHRDHPMGYSYPALLQTPDGQLHAAYSMLRKTIKYLRFDPSWLTAGEQ